MERLGVGIVGFHHLHSLDYLPHFDAIARAEVLAVAEADPAYLKRVVRSDRDRRVRGLQHASRAGGYRPRGDPAAARRVPKRCGTGRGGRQARDCREADGQYVRGHPAHDRGHGSSGRGADSSPYCWRAHPASRKIKELVDRGFLGQIVALEGRCAAGSPLRYLEDGISPWLNQRAIAGGGPDAQPGNPLDRSVQMDPSGRSRTGDRHGEPPAASPGH